MIKFRFMTIIFVSVAVAATLAVLQGCAGLGTRLEPPEVSLANITVQEAKGFETSFELDIRVFNTNDIPLEIKGVDCKLEINGRNLAKGVSATQTKVPAFGTDLVKIIVYSSMLDMASSMLDMIRSAQSGKIKQKLTYKISGKLRLGGDSIMPSNLPFKSQGELNLEGLSTNLE